MSLAEELDRLADLHARGVLSSEEFARAKSQMLAARSVSGYTGYGFRGVRRESSRRILGLPLWSIAFGPDLERGELRGHARGVFALGDLATGWLAFGGLARGLVAAGGLAFGLFAFGGGAVGILVAFGGAAVGGFAVGGAALGVVAIGGAAAGYYAMGGAAVGAHTISALGQDPDAVTFFSRFAPWLRFRFPRR
jgi:hypothetical protein